MGKAGFGKLVMLTHVDTEDPDRLLIAAQLNAAWWAADDLYADDTEQGATPTELPPRLALVMAAMDPVAPAGEFSIPLDQALRSDPVLLGLGSGIEHLSRHASPAQVQRVCYSTFAMFVSWNAYAAWRYTGAYPPAWEYLAARQHDSFYTSMTLIDPVGGYELDAGMYYQPRVRQALTQAGTASVMLNDLVSVAKDAADENPVCNMVLQVAADRGCSIAEATAITVDLHNNLVRDFEENAAQPGRGAVAAAAAVPARSEGVDGRRRRMAHHQPALPQRLTLPQHRAEQRGASRHPEYADPAAFGQRTPGQHGGNGVTGIRERTQPDPPPELARPAQGCSARRWPARDRARPAPCRAPCPPVPCRAHRSRTGRRVRERRTPQRR